MLRLICQYLIGRYPVPGYWYPGCCFCLMEVWVLSVNENRRQAASFLEDRVSTDRTSPTKGLSCCKYSWKGKIKALLINLAVADPVWYTPAMVTVAIFKHQASLTWIHSHRVHSCFFVFGEVRPHFATFNPLMYSSSLGLLSLLWRRWLSLYV